MNTTSCIMESNELPGKTPLRQLREAAGLTRPQVRDRIGVSERMQADWENGTSIPSTEKMLSLAKLYGVSFKTIYKCFGFDVSDVPDD